MPVSSFWRLMSFTLMLCLVVAFANAASLGTSDGEVIVNSWGYRLQGDTGTGGELLPGPLAASPRNFNRRTAVPLRSHS